MAQEAPRVHVIDATSLEPVPGVSIRALGNSAGKVRTDARGEARLPGLSQGDSVLVYHPLYQTRRLSFGDLRELNFRLPLREATFSTEEIVISHSETEQLREQVPAEMQVLTSKTVQLYNPPTPAHLLETGGRVFVQRSQVGGGSPVLRGFEANKILLAVDGLRGNTAIFRGGHLQNVLRFDVNAIDRVEVSFGPAAVQYGSDALGGVIHFRTKEVQLGTPEAPYYRVNGLARYSSAANEVTAHADFNAGFGKWGSFTSVTISQYDDLRMGNLRSPLVGDFGLRPVYADRINGRDTIVRNPDPNLQTPSGYAQLDLLQKFDFRPNARTQHTLNFQFSTTTDVPRYDRLTDTTADGQLRRAEWYYGPEVRALAGYRFRHYRTAFYDRLEVNLGFSYLRESRHTRRFGDPWRNNRRENVQLLQLKAVAHKKLDGSGKHTLFYGVDTYNNWVESNADERNLDTDALRAAPTRYPDGGSTMGSAAAFLRHQWQPHPEWRLGSAARFNHLRLDSRFDQGREFYPFLPQRVQQQQNALTGALELVWLPSPKWRLAGILSNGFRSPNVDDLGKVFDSNPGLVIVPNEDLSPEYTYTAELGLTLRPQPWLELETRVHYTAYRNAIVLRRDAVNGRDSILYDGVLSAVVSNQNAARAELYGVSFRLAAELNRAVGFEQTLTWTQGQDLSANVPLGHIPPVFGRSQFNFRHRRVEAVCYALYNAWKRIADYSPTGEDNQRYALPEGMPAWYTLNLKVNYAFAPWLQLSLGCENLLDHHYRAFASGVSGPGRNAIVAVRTRW